ncbi:MAG: TaqI-like C-terminal specificity domain-containing protein, partial [Balneolaceae bacterium]|nr:TaqI-like C-terminal specificity domain-containing protein [Balneolaceae bacterium]
RGVIELKGTETTDLGKVETQAFGYRNKQPDAHYIIISNFEKLRFYIDNAVDFIEFNLFTLSKEEFNVLWLCLGYPNFAKGLPKKIKDASLTEEENVTKKLYKDYSDFKHDIFESVKKHNPEHDPLLLFKKTQKLLDRFLFIFFAEDRNLLPPNSIKKIIQQWHQLKDLDEYRPLYERFVKYFGYLNEGRNMPGKDEIFAYNGGLFAEDEILDSLTISDELLYKHTLQLSKYDFVTEVDVNILGHIFEHSLNEIEEINAELKGEEVDTSKSRRKKDGVFYTPKYITKYIVEHTVGTLCEEQKEKLEIDDEEYRPNRQKKTKKDLLDRLEEYRNWLLDLTICDPACGSGAFLNQALDFLIAEHAYVDELQAKLLDEAMVLPDLENQILENNLFGVDINEESVEIAKLSLWLRTAEKGRKLTSLNNNIKCGNSLIDDPEVAGEKAFDWEAEFPSVFENGGFDVVIGNPPYVSSKGENFSDPLKKYFIENYSTSVYQIDLYLLFLEQSVELINKTGLTSFIVPNAWLNNLHLEEVRKYFLKNVQINEIVTMPSDTFEQATVDTIITSFSKNPSENNETKLSECKEEQFFERGTSFQTEWEQNELSIINPHVTTEVKLILDKIKNNSIRLESFTEIGRGVGVYHKRVGHTKEFIASDPYQSEEKEDETFVPYLKGKNVTHWYINWKNDKYISYGEWLAEPRHLKFFEGKRIVLRQIPAKKLVATYLENKFITDQSVFVASFTKETDFEPKPVLAVMTSTLMSFYFRFFYSEFDDLFPKVKLKHFKSLPISNSLPDYSSELNDLADERLNRTDEFYNLIESLCDLLLSKFDIEKLSRKLQSWHELTFKQFLKELKKKKVKLSLEEEAEWMDYFNKQKAEAEELKSQIAQTDSEIDAMVYELYGLTGEEIGVVEGS